MNRIIKITGDNCPACKLMDNYIKENYKNVDIETDNSSAFGSPTTAIAYPASTAKTGSIASTSGAIADNWMRVNATIASSSAPFTLTAVAGVR